MTSPVFATLFTVAALAVAPAARPIDLRVDPERSQVTFTLGATLHTVEGHFDLESGHVSYDPSTGAVSGEIVVDATSGETGIGRRDRNMHRKVLRSSEYPEIVFRPRRVEGDFDSTGTSTLTVYGALILLGQEHPLSVPVEIEISGEQVRAVATMTIPYVEWGLDDPSNFFLRVEESVDVRISIVGHSR